MNFIPLAKPNISDQDIEAVVEVLRSGMLVQGENVLQLEKNITDLTGACHASAVSNGTASLHLALIQLGIGKGDEVIVPAFSYVATANVVELTGATPVFVDIDLQTFNIDPTLIERAINERTKAIMPVHEFGLAADMASIMDIANKHQLAVIEDAACALGATFKGKPVGTFGDYGSFSLHPRKAVSSGEGGIVITNDPGKDRRIKILRNHGVEMLNGEMHFVDFGFNYRMTDFQAALVKNQVKRVPEIIKYKQQLAEIYLNEINSPAITLPAIPEACNHTWQTFHIILGESLKRDHIIQSMKTKGIGTNYGAQCIPETTAYQNKYGYDSAQLFPNALRAFRQGLALPLYDKLSKEDIQFVATMLRESI